MVLYLSDLVVVGQEHGQVLRFLNGGWLSHFSQELGSSDGQREKNISKEGKDQHRTYHNQASLNTICHYDNQLYIDTFIRQIQLLSDNKNMLLSFLWREQ